MVIAFDLDDTLYKEVDYVKSGYKAVAEENAGIIAPAVSYRLMWEAFKAKENPFDAVAKAVKGFDIAKAVATYRFHRPSITLDADTEKVLQRLKDAGHRLCIITDGRTATQRNKIETLSLPRYVDPADVVISEETGHTKADADNFRIIAERYPSERCIYVGDNPEKDFFHPNRMGWHTVMLKDNGLNSHPQTDKPAEWEAERVIASLTELPDYIETLNE